VKSARAILTLTTSQNTKKCVKKKEKKKEGKVRITKIITNICEECGKKITNGIGEYSLNEFGKYLCIDCQCEERLKGSKYPKKLALFLNKEAREKYG